MGFKQKEWDLKVKKISKMETENKDGDTITYKLVAEDMEGLTEIAITSAEPFVGLNVKSGVIQVVLKNSQKALADFKEGIKDIQDKSKEE
jgi:hypothetical protein